MNYLKKILLLNCFMFCVSFVFSQNNQSYFAYKEILKVEKIKINYRPYFIKIENATDLASKVAPQKKIDLSPIYFKMEDLATFCKLELKLEKAVNMPIKFRLGEVQYVERLEGKY
ncbi:MAG: hypothetical protein AAFZ15_25490 [Bacteroidota bacterium]